MTIEQAKKKIQKEYVWAGKKAIAHLLTVGLRAAKSWSLGPVTYAMMRKEDYPYAKRHGSPKRDPRRINTHTGAFLRGWFTSKVSSDRDIGGAVINDTEVADYLKNGTRFMVPRPVNEPVEEAMQKAMPQAERLFTRELERGNK
jgi:hypothetical protein